MLSYFHASTVAKCLLMYIIMSVLIEIPFATVSVKALFPSAELIEWHVMYPYGWS